MCRDELVTLFRTGSLVTGNGLPPSWKIEGKICLHKFACRNVTPKKNKRLQVAFTHARVLMGSSVYRPGPEED